MEESMASTERKKIHASAEKRTSRAPARSGPVRIRVNGQWHRFRRVSDVTPSMTLAHLLREKLGLTGLKVACDHGACGACMVLMDGKAVTSRMVLAVEGHGHSILTIEGLSKDDLVVEAFAEQCGYCTPGFVVTSRALLDENPTPTLEEVKEALSENICRCGCYAAIARVVLHASKKIGAAKIEQ